MRRQAKWWEDPDQVEDVESSPRPLVHQGPPREPTPVTPTQEELDRANIERIRNDPSNSPAAQAKMAAEAALAAQQAAQGGGPNAQNQQDEARMRRANIEAVTNAVKTVEQRYGRDFKGGGIGQSIREFLPAWSNPTNQAFDSAAAGLSNAALAITKVPGQGSQSDLEAIQFILANQPGHSDFDETIEQKIANIKNRVDTMRAGLGLPPADWGKQGSEGARQDDPLAQAAGAVPPPPPGQQGDPRADRTTNWLVSPSNTSGASVAGGDMRIENNPAWAGANAKINQMLRSGASDQQIMAYVKTIAPEGRDQVKARQQLIAIRKFQKANPGYDGDYHIDMERWQVPNSVVNQVSAGPVGAYGINAANALTMGTLDNMTANPALTRAGIEGVRQANPKSSLAGTVTGGVMAAGAAELGAARLGLQGGRAALAGDAAYGAGYGAGSTDEGSRLIGAVKGAGAAGAGGVAGRAAVRGGGRLLTGTRDAATRMLRERGVPLTLGQIAGRGGVVGRGVKKIEDALESVPLLGAAIQRRRAEGVEGFNQAAFREALEPIPPATVSTIGEQGVEQAQAATGGAYDDALNGVRVQAEGDGIFVRDMTRAVKAGSKLHPETAGAFQKLVQNEVAEVMADGTLSGEGYQILRRIIREEKSLWKSRPHGRQYGQALRQLEGALESMVRRQAPGVTEKLNAADRAYRQSGVVRDAVGRGKNTGGVFTPAQLGMAAEANAKRFGGAGTTQRPFFDLQRAGQDVLPSSIPNSGTADRVMAAGLLPALPGLVGGGAAYAGAISPETAGVMALLGLPFTRAGQAAFQKMLIDRPELVREAGEKLIRRGTMAGGLLGAPAGASLAAPQ